VGGPSRLARDGAHRHVRRHLHGAVPASVRDMPIDYRDPTGPTASRGRSYVYVLPCAYEDLLKLGFSRDPLQRAQALHPRYFEFFDVNRALLVETETVRDARAIELRLRRTLAVHNAPAPLTVNEPAGGHTEWYRGAYDALHVEVLALAAAGHTTHVPARDWMAAAQRQRAPLMFDWAASIAAAEDLDVPDLKRPLQRNLRDSLDACVAFGIEVASCVPEPVARWHASIARR